MRMKLWSSCGRASVIALRSWASAAGACMQRKALQQRPDQR